MPPSSRAAFASSLQQRATMDNSGDGPLRTPGVGVSVDYQLPPRHRFAHGMDDWAMSCHVTAREIAMLQAMETVTDQVGWEHNVSDPVMTAQWRANANRRHGYLISDKAWEWCVAELSDKARRYRETGSVRVLDVGSVVCKTEISQGDSISDSLVRLSKELIQEISGSSDERSQVMDTIDPYWYPLVYDRTKVLSDGGQVSLDTFDSWPEGRHLPTMRLGRGGIERHPILGHSITTSTKFQWLPCEVTFPTKDGELKPAITSYINNVNPKLYKGFYSVFQNIIGASIQPWNEVLLRALPDSARSTDFLQTRAGQIGAVPFRIRTYGVSWPQEEQEIVSCMEAAMGGSDQDAVDALEGLLQGCTYGAVEVCDKWTSPNSIYWVYLNWRVFKKYLHSEPGQSFTYEEWKAGKTSAAVIPKQRLHVEQSVPDPDHFYYTNSIQDQFRDQGLQVVIQMRSIELTPGRAVYDGDDWHFAGIRNERIAATAFFCFEAHNVTQARIEFRQRANFDPEEVAPREHTHHLALMEVFGIPRTPDDNECLEQQKMVQTIGSVALRRNRHIACPNTLETRWLPFQLADGTQPGRLQVLMLHLVDPNYRILSTRNVPPQRDDWWRNEVAGLGLWRVKDISPEVAELIMDETRGELMDQEEAELVRNDMVEEREKLAEYLASEIDEYGLMSFDI